MYVLEGGPRAGQLVDDLPEGYALDATPGPSFPAAVIGDIPAATAVWTQRESRRIRPLRRLN
jgi:hypothetical protein